MPLRGDLGKLKSFVQGFASRVSAGSARREQRLMEEAKAALQTQVAECFLYQRDPHGRPWPARTTVYGDFRDTNPLLFDLLSYFTYEIVDTGSGFRIELGNSKYYAFFHMKRYKGRPARPFTVEPGESAPLKLRQRLELAGTRAARRIAGLAGGLDSGGYYASYEVSGGR